MKDGAVSSDADVMALRPDVVSTVLDQGAVLLDLETKYFYTVNSSGWAVLQMLEQGASRRQIAAQCLAWGMPEAEQADLERFLNQLASERLIEAGGDSGAPQAPLLEGPWRPPQIEKQKEPLQRIMASAFDPSLPLAE